MSFLARATPELTYSALQGLLTNNTSETIVEGALVNDIAAELQDLSSEDFANLTVQSPQLVIGPSSHCSIERDGLGSYNLSRQ